MKHKQVLVLRKDLGMRKGKMVAQGAHASQGALFDIGHIEDDWLMIPLDGRTKPWVCGEFTKVCVSVCSESELLALYEKAREAGLITKLIKDAGHTEFHGVPTYTAVAIGPDEDWKIDPVTGHLPLL